MVVSKYAQFTNISNFIHQLVSFFHLASNPYWDWLWDNKKSSTDQIVKWFENPDSELSFNRMTCITENDVILGGIIALSGNELRQCRRNDFFTLFNFARQQADSSAIILRIKYAHQFFPNVSDDEYYLSRIGVQNGNRGQGVGKRLLQTYLQLGEKKGFTKFRLDVATDNIRAIRLYTSAGFTISNISAVAEIPFRYYSMALTINNLKSIYEK